MLKIIMNRGNVWMIDKGDGINPNSYDKKVFIFNSAGVLADEFMQVALKWGYWNNGSGLDNLEEESVLKEVEKLVAKI